MSLCKSNICRNSGQFNLRSIFKLWFTLSLTLLLAVVAKADAGDSCSRIIYRDKPLMKLKNGLFDGLTPDAIDILIESRKAFLQRESLYRSQILGMGSFYHVGNVARLVGGHVFLSGPPGGAKSMFANFFMSGEPEEVRWAIQMNQMLSSELFSGGLDHEAQNRGETKFNFTGSLAERAKVALIDELDKGTPATYGPLLQMLEERKVDVGGKTHLIPLETVFATSNASVAEMAQMFRENSQESTFPALMNRFWFKGFVYNWLSVEHQATLDKRRKRKRRLEAMLPSFPELINDEVFLKPDEVDWQALREIAYSLFTTSEKFDSVARELERDTREGIFSDLRDHEELMKDDPDLDPIFPTADLSERSRGPIPDIVIMSAFFDFLTSPLASEEYIEQNTKKEIELDPLSLWRAYKTLTTVGPGETSLIYVPDQKVHVDVAFEFEIDRENLRDAREIQLIANMVKDQERFETIYKEHMHQYNDLVQQRIEKGLFGGPTIDESSFEVLMMLLNREGM